MSHIETSVKSRHVRFYDKHKDRYCASLMVHIEGSKGFVYSLQGNRFYELFPLHYKQLFKECEITSIECWMTQDHAEYFQEKMTPYLSVKVLESSVAHNRAMYWIRIRMR